LLKIILFQPTKLAFFFDFGNFSTLKTRFSPLKEEHYAIFTPFQAI